MPSIVTHYLFSEDVLKSTKKNIQETILKSHELYNIFAQSFDNLFYYNLLSLKKGKEIRRFGNLAQRSHTNEYFKNMIDTIKEEKQTKNPDALAYLYGSLTHYILDSFCHPFIIYHAGWMDDEKPNYQYRGNHEKLEVNIDAVLYQEKRNKKLYRESLGNILLPKINFSKELKTVIDKTYQKTFQKENIGTIYEKSTQQGHNILKYFVTDHYGIKKTAYKIFDFTFKKNKTKYQNLSFYIKDPQDNFLNRNHQIWYNPTDKQISSNESFDDLYKKALKEAIYIFNLTDKVINNDISMEIYLKELGNKSYTTGLDCSQKEYFQYFKNENLE